MAYGKGSVTSGGMNQHKEMAGASDKGNFGVRSVFSGGKQTQAAPKSFGEMNDSGRAAGLNVGGRQAAPDHGDMGKSHFTYGGKL